MTPREIAIHAAGFVERDREASKQAIHAAWITAKLIRAAEIPPFDKLVPPPPLPPEMRSAVNRARMDALKRRRNAGESRKQRNG